MQEKYLDNNSPSRTLNISNPPNGLTICNFMLACRHVIVSYISWEVNNGEDILFWMDLWNGQPTLNIDQDLQVAKRIISTIWGTKLIDYV